MPATLTTFCHFAISRLRNSWKRSGEPPAASMPSAAKRSYAVPEIPTVGETVAGYEAVGWQGLVGPKAIPKDIVARWNNEINRIVQRPDEKEYLAALGIDAADGSPEQFHAFLKREIAKWQKVVKVAGIKPER